MDRLRGSVYRSLVSPYGRGREYSIREAVATNKQGVIPGAVRYGGNPNITTDGKSILYQAIENGNQSIVRQLLDSGAKCNRNCLETAVRKGNQQIVRLLLAKTPRTIVNQKNRSGETSLHAVFHTLGKISKKILQLLIENGAEVNEQDNKGNTPLHMAVMKHDADAVQLLLENGALINTQNNDGMTPLHCAYDLNVIKTLYKHGANPNIKDNAGKTPIVHLIDETNDVNTIIESIEHLPEQRREYQDIVKSIKKHVAPDSLNLYILSMKPDSVSSDFFIKNKIIDIHANPDKRYSMLDTGYLIQSTPFLHAVGTNNVAMVKTMVQRYDIPAEMMRKAQHVATTQQMRNALKTQRITDHEYQRRRTSSITLPQSLRT